MRKGYLTRRSISVFGRGIGPAPIALVVLVAAALLLRLAAPGLFVTVFSPVWKIGEAGSAVAERMTGFFHDRSTLVAERDAALADAAAARAQAAAASVQVADLTRLLGTRTQPAPGIVAAVIARPPVAAYDTLIVDQGSGAGVAPGAIAYGPGGIPLGVVASVTSASCRIVLYSAPGQQTGARIGAAQVPVTLMGLGAGAFYAEAPRTASTTVGDAVEVDGPGALSIGTVARVESDPSSPTAVVRVKPFLNPFTLTWVTIGRSPAL